MINRFSFCGAVIAVATVFASMATNAIACTNFIVGKNASADGSVMVTYADDSHTRYGELHHSSARTYSPGDKRQVIDWGTNEPKGWIPQVVRTYNVVGNMNENQVVIGETTWTGHSELADTTGINLLDYGSLIYIALERAKTAREAIIIMTELAETYGYASTGETFSIADKNEAWMMEMIGKGAEKGAVWIAVRIPDNAITAHANEPRIRKVNLKDKKNVMYAKDLIPFARKHGYFNGKDEDFSFADAFDGHAYAKRRSCDARVWSFLRRFASPEEDAAWFEWVTGNSDEPMPMWIVPNHKVTLQELQERMRDHYEDTPFAMTDDPGAGPFNAPVRFRPMKYEVDGKKYTHERPTATMQTAWSFITQSRSDLPDPIGGVIWFGTDDANTTVYMPFYCSMTEAPLQVREGEGSMTEFSMDSNFWMNNWVANQAYAGYSKMIPDIRKVQNALESSYIASRPEVEKKMMEMYREGDIDGVRKAATKEGAAIAKEATDAYRNLAQYLLVKFLDGNIKKQDADGNFITNPYGRLVRPDEAPYNEEYLKNIVEHSGERFAVKQKQ